MEDAKLACQKTGLTKRRPAAIIPMAGENKVAPRMYSSDTASVPTTSFDAVKALSGLPKKESSSRTSPTKNG
jgi:hypothetical protein